jgi:hypothetical protein
VEGFRTIAERISRPGRIRSAQTPNDHAISEAEIGCTCPGTIEDQPLVLDEHRFGDHGPRAAGTGESGDCRQQVDEEDGQVAHGAIVAS